MLVCASVMTRNLNGQSLRSAESIRPAFCRTDLSSGACRPGQECWHVALIKTPEIWAIIALFTAILAALLRLLSLLRTGMLG